MSWTVAKDVLDAWIGSDAPDDLASVTTWLGRAERLVRSEVPGLQARIDGGLEPGLLEDVRDVVVSMVERKFRNPEGVRTRQESTGPFSGSVTLGGDQPGELWVTDSELKRLRLVGSATGAVGTVDTIPITSPFSPNYVAATYPW
jgi:hypothetical protein